MTDLFRNRSKIRANDEKTVKMTTASRSNKCDVLNLTERRFEVEEVNAADVVQEIVELPRASDWSE